MTSLKSYPENPLISMYLQKFSTPRDTGFKYGQRIYGYFVPPETGDYIFATSCSNECKLFLSKTDSEEKKDEIITNEENGPQDVSSDPVSLKGGYTYFIEAQSFHNKGDSPMKVGVRLPSSSILAPIPSKLLRLERGGLVDEEFNSLPTATVRSLLTQASLPNNATAYHSLDNFDLKEYGSKGKHGHRIKGYFLATETGNYRFYGKCTQGCRLYLGDDDSCRRRSVVFDYTRNSKDFNTKRSIRNEKHGKNQTETKLFKRWRAITNKKRTIKPESMFDLSKPIPLEAGLYYYIEALHATKGGKDNFKIGFVPPSGRSQFPIQKDRLLQFNPNKHGIIRELWKNIKGENIQDLQMSTNYPNIPYQVNLLKNFETPSANRYNYGQRLRGYFVAPMTGEYRFVMSCDRRCELWLSPSEKQEHKKRMLKVTKRTERHQYNKHPEEQISIPIPMDIGKQYYLEAVHKAGTGLDHLSVGVTLPSGKNEWPISKKYIRFRPKSDEMVTSHLSVPCSYDQTIQPEKKLNQDDTTKATVASDSNGESNSRERIEGDLAAILGNDYNVELQSESKQYQNAEQFLGEEKSVENTGEDTNTVEISNEKVTNNNNKKDTRLAWHKQKESPDTKVKVTHLELPFGVSDGKTAEDALNVLDNLDEKSKSKIKITRNKNGSKGFTLSGLPSFLTKEEVTKVAKGLASVMDTNASPSKQGVENPSDDNERTSHFNQVEMYNKDEYQGKENTPKEESGPHPKLSKVKPNERLDLKEKPQETPPAKLQEGRRPAMNPSSEADESEAEEKPKEKTKPKERLPLEEKAEEGPPAKLKGNNRPAMNAPPGAVEKELEEKARKETEDASPEKPPNLAISKPERVKLKGSKRPAMNAPPGAVEKELEEKAREETEDASSEKPPNLATLKPERVEEDAIKAPPTQLKQPIKLAEQTSTEEQEGEILHKPASIANAVQEVVAEDKPQNLSPLPHPPYEQEVPTESIDSSTASLRPSANPNFIAPPVITSESREKPEEFEAPPLPPEVQPQALQLPNSGPNTVFIGAHGVPFHHTPPAIMQGIGGYQHLHVASPISPPNEVKGLPGVDTGLHGIGFAQGTGEEVVQRPPVEPFIESVSVVGNALNAPKHREHSQSPFLPSPPHHVLSPAMNGQDSPSYLNGPPVKQPPPPTSSDILLGGDSIGEPVSDMLPGTAIAIGEEEQPAPNTELPEESQPSPNSETNTDGSVATDGGRIQPAQLPSSSAEDVPTQNPPNDVSVSNNAGMIEPAQRPENVNNEPSTFPTKIHMADNSVSDSLTMIQPAQRPVDSISQQASLNSDERKPGMTDGSVAGNTGMLQPAERPGFYGIQNQGLQLMHPANIPPKKAIAINRLTDFDILDVDLDGLNKINTVGPQANRPEMEFPLKRKSLLKSSDAKRLGKLDAALIGETLIEENKETSEFLNMIDKKKKISRSHRKTAD